MHRCLYIPELLCRIILATGVENQGFYEPDRSTLASLVRTCHTFYEPALDVLWRTQYNLDALVKCLPSDSWEQVDGELYFIRPIRLSDCIRFTFHARRIRCLFVEDPGTGGDIAAALGACMMDSPFCNLQTLIADATVLPLKHLLFVPNLAQLTFGSAKQMASILPSLPSRCPFLKNISFDFYSPEEVPAVSEHLRSWVALDCVHVRELDYHALVHLGSMPNLRKLSFSPVPAREAGQPSLLNRFSSLQSLEFITNDRRGCCSFMKSVGTFHLHNFSLDLFCVHDNNSFLHDDTTWVEFFWAVSTHCAHHSLVHIMIRNRSLELSWITLDDFKPLFLFSNLTVFEGHFGELRNIDDAFIKAMAMAWPHLQELSLNHYPRHPRTTLRSLAHLGCYCKELEMVYLCIDGTVVPPAESWPEPLINESVKFLGLQESPISDPAAVAPFLSQLFPNLSQLETRHYFAVGAEEYGMKWDNVLERLQC